MFKLSRFPHLFMSKKKKTNWIIFSETLFGPNLCSLHTIIHVTPNRLIKTIQPLRHQTLVLLLSLLLLLLLLLALNSIGFGVSLAKHKTHFVYSVLRFIFSNKIHFVVDFLATTMCHIHSLNRENFCNNIKFELTATARQRPRWKSNERRKITLKIQIRRSK